MRKLVMVLGALAMFVSAACGGGGGGDDDEAGGEYGSELLTGTTVTVAPRATTAPTAAPRANQGSTPTPTFAPKRTIPTGPGIDAVAKASEGTVGELGPYLLGKATNKIVFELLLQDGLDAQAATLNHVTGELKRYSNNKSVVIERTPLPAGVTQWKTEDLHRYADKYSRFKSGGSTVVLHVLFVHGGMSGSAGTLGVASRADVLTMFPERYKSGALSPAVVEDVVVLHEVGHILGLVDLWLTTGRGDFRDDPAPGGHHSSNKKSVMYFAADTSGIFSLFSGGPPRDFDDADKRDLMAIRDGKARGSKGT